MCKVMLCLISTILLTFVIFETNGQSDYGDSNLSALTQNNYNITNKVNKIAKDILSHSSPNNREFVIKSVEKKLFKAAENLGEKGKKHVQLIMEGIKEKILNFTKQANNHAENNKIAEDNKDSVESTHVANNLSNTIENLINTELDNLKTSESRQKVLGDIKRRFLDSINEKLNVFPEMQQTDDTKQVVNIENEKKGIDTFSDIVKKLSNAELNNKKMASKHTLKSFTVAHICNNAYDQSCNDIQEMNSLKCIYSEEFISLDKLCDGATDCAYGSDEKYCGSQVMERMEFSLKIINKIDNLNEHHCFTMDELSKQTNILHDVLQTQLVFKEQYLNLTMHMNKLAEKKDADSEINRKANEIALIISSLAIALYSTLCSDKFDSMSVPVRRSSSDFNIDLTEMVEKINWPPKCNCVNEHCPDCTDACKRICRHKYNLGNWKCESINGSSAISLNSLCDGKLDCTDESDENGCDTGLGYAKFDAYGIYSTVLKMLNLKVNKERSSTRNKLLYLHNLVTELQKYTTVSEPDKMTIRKIRDQCFAMLNIIYTDILDHSSGSSEIEEAYVFLASVNQNLGIALKRSHTGNDRDLTEGCFCRNGACAVPFCSKMCNKACAAEPKLTVYQCKDLDTKVSLDKICDGKIDCANGYDEQGCMPEEICRRHHLLILRKSLLDVGQHLKGTSLGELIDSWKIQAITIIKAAEKDSRPKPKIFKTIIKDILRSLVVTYGSVDYRRRDKEYGLSEFQKISQIVMEAMKSCGK